MNDEVSDHERLRRATIWFNSKLLGLVLGTLLGLLVFVATNWLIVQVAI